MMKIDLSMTSEVFFQPNKIVEVGELPGTLIAARVRLVQPGHFNRRRHFYPKAVDALIHPTLATFLSLGNEGIISRYHSLHPSVDTAMLEGFLNYNPKYFRWAGADLMKVVDESDQLKLVVIETNSCPSGVKSMPNLYFPLNLNCKESGYHKIIQESFVEMTSNLEVFGSLAVIYDGNPMESSGYAAAMSDIFNEPVFLIEFYQNDSDPPVRWTDGILNVRVGLDDWRPIRACFRYVTKTPWDRIPLNSKTAVLNSVVACLAGGRNKIMAAVAYESFNRHAISGGLAIQTPKTCVNVAKEIIPKLVEEFGGRAVIKVPYSNKGEQVYTVANQAELSLFMATTHTYEKFLVQGLIGKASWFSTVRPEDLYHIGTVPDADGHSYVCDLRMMVMGSHNGFSPVAAYARKARVPLKDSIDDIAVGSWELLGTNLSVKLDGKDNRYTTDTERLAVMDHFEFEQLGYSVDDLIEAYVQTVMAVISIDKICCQLMQDGSFNFCLLEMLNPDSQLIREILR